MENDRDIYGAIGGDLVRLATVLIGPDDAPDVVSTVVARRLERGPLSELRDAREYLMRAVVNESKNVRRARSRAQAAFQRIGGGSQVRDVGEGRFPDVTQSLMSLPNRQRAAVYLVYWVGLSPSEAAAVLECRPATVRRYLVLARRRLKDLLDE